MRRIDDVYILGVPLRRVHRAVDAIGWKLVDHWSTGEGVRLLVRRTLTAMPRYEITLPRETKRRHVIDVIKVRLRMLGA